MAQQTGRTALVTGGNRGIGLEVCRQLGRLGLEIVIGARDADLGAAAAEELQVAGIKASAQKIDVSDEASVYACAERLSAAGVHIDVLVNNAGVYPDGGKLATMTTDYFRQALATNFLGAFWTARTFLPGMRRKRYGRIVNVSTGYGSFAEGLQGPPAYSISKAALNALTVKLAQEAPASVKINAACPGWVKTRMGGSGAKRPVKKGAETIVWLATLPDDGPNGGFFRDQQPIGW